MKEEALRLDRVTYLDQSVTELNHFCLNVFAGEIMGIVPLNGTGMQPLMRLLRQNTPIHYGYVYYREKLVNQWRHSDGSYNRIRVIESRSGLADDLTVADNVFVLRQGFRKRFISRDVLRRQLQPFLADIGVDISADACARDLTVFERFVVELVKAVVAGSRLVVLLDAGTVISDTELNKLHGILRHYAQKGLSFLYISQHYEEIRQVCDRAALMLNGQIVKVLSTAQTEPAVINCFGVEQFQSLARAQEGRLPPDAASAPALELRNLWYQGIADLSFTIAPGECVVLHDLDNNIIDDLVALMTFRQAPERGDMRLGGASAFHRRDVAVIQKLATKTMLFPQLSYLDNLCFTMDHQLKRVWVRTKPKKSVRRECEPFLGSDVFDKSIDELTPLQKYDLIYARILLQRPKAVFCVQPFMQADVQQRMHIWMLLERLLAKGIAVVILAVNLSDTLPLADRLIRVKDGRVQGVYERSQFGALPDSTPWHHLWNEKLP